MSSRIKELDALRGIAALGVVLFHYTLGRAETQYSFKLGITGVDLFFMISGFVIFMSIQKITSSIEFLINRFTRLYPTYWTCVTITALLQVLIYLCSSSNQTSISLLKYLANLTMFQHYFKINDIDGSYWTMIIELQFYLLIAFLLSLKVTKHIVPFFLLLMLMIGTYSILLEQQFPNLNASLTYAFRLFAHFPLFFAGILAYNIREQKDKLYMNYLFIGLCFVIQSSLYNNSSKASSFISQKEYIAMLGIYFTIFILFINHKLQFIATKATLFLGKISFALYLIHQYIGTVVIIPLITSYIIHSFWIVAFIALLISLCLATFITYTIEIPVGQKMNSALKSKIKLTPKDS